MRDIKEIIDELKSHPDLIHCEIYTKSDIIDDLEVKYSDELGISDVSIQKDDIDEDEWYEIGDQICNYYINSYENLGPPWRVDEDTSDLEELDQRIKRTILLNHILSSK